MAAAGRGRVPCGDGGGAAARGDSEAVRCVRSMLMPVGKY